MSSEIIAQGGGFTISEDPDLGVVIKGLGEFTYWMDKDRWDIFAAVIRLADLSMQEADQ